MSSRRLLALGVVIATVAGIVVWRSSGEVGATSSDVARESRRTVSDSASSQGGSSGRAEAPSSNEAPQVHPSDMTAWAADRIDPEAFRAAVVDEMERVALAGTWLDRLDLEGDAPSCARCEPALDEEVRTQVREALAEYDATLSAVANREVRGAEAVEVYRVARRDFLAGLPFQGLVWLGGNGFLDTRLTLSAIRPNLHRSTEERLPAAGNRFDDPGLQGI